MDSDKITHLIFNRRLKELNKYENLSHSYLKKINNKTYEMVFHNRCKVCNNPFPLTSFVKGKDICLNCQRIKKQNKQLCYICNKDTLDPITSWRHCVSSKEMYCKNCFPMDKSLLDKYGFCEYNNYINPNNQHKINISHLMRYVYSADNTKVLNTLLYISSQIADCLLCTNNNPKKLKILRKFNRKFYKKNKKAFNNYLKAKQILQKVV